MVKQWKHKLCAQAQNAGRSTHAFQTTGRDPVGGGGDRVGGEGCFRAADKTKSRTYPQGKEDTQTACVGCYRHKEIHQHAVLCQARAVKFVELSLPSGRHPSTATRQLPGAVQWLSVRPALAAVGTSCVLWCSLKPLLTNFDTTAACACTREAKTPCQAAAARGQLSRCGLTWLQLQL